MFGSKTFFLNSKDVRDLDIRKLGRFDEMWVSIIIFGTGRQFVFLLFSFNVLIELDGKIFPFLFVLV